jgi:hypothetical protein
MNQDKDRSSEVRQIPYMPGVHHNTQYVSINLREMLYIRRMYGLFWGHVMTERDSGFEGRGYYTEVFEVPRRHLPKPSKLKQRYNTWGTFLQGLEWNFQDGTRHFTEKQLPHIAEAVNMAVVYFTDIYPDFLPEEQAYQIEFV